MSELDEAMAALHQERSVQDQLAAAQHAEATRCKRRFIALVEDFLARMATVGYPGTTLDFRGERAWALRYQYTDKPLSLILTVNGNVPYAETKPQTSRWGGTKYVSESGLRSYRDADVRLRDDELDRLARSMADLLLAAKK